ncbi:MAG: hypothetical protein ACI9LN_000029 [Saprospiraceae bacterium]|jgi:hypothetical protein
MKNKLTILLLLFSTAFLFAQTDSNFQQEVNYKIDVTLDDEAHTLEGNIEIEYTNNAPTALAEIWMHLWPNAYKNINTAFSKQQIRLGDTDFYFAENSDFGYLDKLDFKVNDNTATWAYDEKNGDIAKITLSEPLKKGEKIMIKTPFLLKIPASFSRLGHVDQSYQLTQWFPKPAVFDHKGWHPMPYLNMGEFYSEFGSFEVQITLPENYVVGATGVLETDSEKDFLKEKIEETTDYFKNKAANKLETYGELDTFPFSSQTMKTLVYTAEKVHDFAWFADKRFKVQKSEVTLKSGQKVDTWTMFTEQQADYWGKSIDYVNRSIEYYSEMVGEYPWPQATAVQSALSAGGGMEYPMITVIGLAGSPKDLDQVITHEVGHNWFYGILASNERDHAWMDEGMNTYYEYQYMKKYYGGSRVVQMGPAFFEAKTDVDNMEAAWLLLARKQLDQAPETHSDDFSQLNYGISSYVKPGSAMQHLEGYLGEETFNEIMQGYYKKWAFKHPYPEDFRAYVMSQTDKNLDWFFDGYINSIEKMDYAIANISTENDGIGLTIKNKGQLNAPFPISGMKDGKIVETRWFDGFSDKKEISFPKGDYDKIVLDAEHTTLELYRTNNNIKTSGLLKKVEPLRLKFAPSVENPQKSDVFWLPAIGYNVYDKFMAGLTFYNRTLPSKRLEFAVTPMYAFGTKDLVGVGNVVYNVYPKNTSAKQLTLGLDVKSFTFDQDSLIAEIGAPKVEVQYKFAKFAPYLVFTFRKSPKSNIEQQIKLQAHFINEEVKVNDDSTGLFTGKEWDNNVFYRLTYDFKNKDALMPFSAKVNLEQHSFKDVFQNDQSYIKSSLELAAAYVYDENRQVDFRLFFGYFIENTERDKNPRRHSFYPTAQGFNDYTYDGLYFGRNTTTSWESRQVNDGQGGLKVPLLQNPKSVSYGSNDYLFGLNLKADLPKDLPLNLPVKPYFDMVYSKSNKENSTSEDQFFWSGGVMLDFFDGAVAVNFPIVNSDNIEFNYKVTGRDDFFKRITFKIDFQRLNPWKLSEESIGL